MKLKLTKHYQTNCLPHSFVIRATWHKYTDGAFYWAGFVVRFRDKYFSFGIKNDRARKEEVK